MIAECGNCDMHNVMTSGVFINRHVDEAAAAILYRRRPLDAALTDCTGLDRRVRNIITITYIAPRVFVNDKGPVASVDRGNPRNRLARLGLGCGCRVDDVLPVFAIPSVSRLVESAQDVLCVDHHSGSSRDWIQARNLVILPDVSSWTKARRPTFTLR